MPRSTPAPRAPRWLRRATPLPALAAALLLGACGSGTIDTSALGAGGPAHEPTASSTSLHLQPGEAAALPTVDVPAGAGRGPAVGGTVVVRCPPGRGSAGAGAASTDVFGATSADAAVSTGSLLGGSSTCSAAGDRSAYWLSTVLVDGRPQRAERLDVSYRHVRREGRVVPPPPGLRLRAGGEGADPVVGGARRWGWDCSSLLADGVRPAPPGRCPDGDALVLRVDLPDCWDGRRLDSADGASAHVAYSAYDALGLRSACPPSHPLPLPQLRYDARYPVTSGDVTLAPGGGDAVSAGFVGAWEVDRLAALTAHLNDGAAFDPAG